MKLFSPAWLDKHYSKVMVGAIIIYVLPFVILIGLAVSILLFPPPPQSFDFNEYSTGVSMIEMVILIDSSDPVYFDSLKTIPTEEVSSLLDDLSQLPYQRSLNFLLGISGKCFRLALEDDTIIFICSSGVAKFSPNEVENGKTFGLSVNNVIYNNLWNRYLKP
jgi:hypothetical protein